MTINLFGFLCLWVLWSVTMVMAWCIGHDKGYTKSRKYNSREYNK